MAAIPVIAKLAAIKVMELALFKIAYSLTNGEGAVMYGQVAGIASDVNIKFTTFITQIDAYFVLVAKNRFTLDHILEFVGNIPAAMTSVVSSDMVGITSRRDLIFRALTIVRGKGTIMANVTEGIDDIAEITDAAEASMSASGGTEKEEVTELSEEAAAAEGASGAAEAALEELAEEEEEEEEESASIARVLQRYEEATTRSEKGAFLERLRVMLGFEGYASARTILARARESMQGGRRLRKTRKNRKASRKTRKSRR